MTTICEHCGRPFIPTTRGAKGREQRYCSRACSGFMLRGVPKQRKNPPERVRKNCLQCGEEFVVLASKLKHDACNFCSLPCARKFKTQPVAVRFQKFVGQPEPNGCILWIGGHNGEGYGAISSGPPNKRPLLAHRVSYEIAKGPIPEGMDVLHECDTPRCINPDHLFLGTNLDNIRDKHAKGREAKGEMIAQAKLTREIVAKIRERYAAGGISQASLGMEYGVAQATIGQVIRGRSWK